MIVYWLYDGQSEDGRGTAKLIRKTTKKKEAVAHFKRCRNPYSTGYVMVENGLSFEIAMGPNLEV